MWSYFQPLAHRTVLGSVANGAVPPKKTGAGHLKMKMPYPIVYGTLTRTYRSLLCDMTATGARLPRHVRWVKMGVLLPEMWTKIRHEFQLYDVTDTLRRRLDYNVGLPELCFDIFFEFWDLKKWQVDLHVECILRTIFDLCTLKYNVLRTLYLRSCNIEFPRRPSFCTACMHLENMDHAGEGVRPNPPNPRGTGLLLQA